MILAWTGVGGVSGPKLSHEAGEWIPARIIRLAGKLPE
jgi:uncharacterized protein involved in response to NO